MSGTEEIQRTIPHRPPFLFVDEIVQHDANSIVTRRKVRADEPYFAGHYPGNPIMPGVLLSEAVFQSGAILLVKKMTGGTEGLTPVLTRIRDARFKNIVRPGDELEIHVQETERMGQFVFLRGRIESGGKKILTIDFGLALIDEKAGESK